MKGKQLEFQIKTWGGKRKGAGRKNRSGLQAHLKRPSMPKNTPLHVTIKLNPGLPSLRRKIVLRAFQRASVRARDRFGLRIIHFALLSNHAHFLIEAGSNEVLHRGMKSLNISLAKFLLKQKRRTQSRNGKVVSRGWKSNASSRTIGPTAQDSQTIGPTAQDSQTIGPAAQDSRTIGPAAADSRTTAPTTADSQRTSPTTADSRAIGPTASNSRTPVPTAAESDRQAFRGRFFVTYLGTPTQVKNTLKYIFFNTSKHQGLTALRTDPFSSGILFSKWNQLLTSQELKKFAPPQISLIPPDVFDLCHQSIHPPHSWLAQTGWTRQTKFDA